MKGRRHDVIPMAVLKSIILTIPQMLPSLCIYIFLFIFFKFEMALLLILPQHYYY